MKKRLFQLIIAILIALPGVMAQTVSMPALTVNPGQVLVPVTMTGFTNVAAITLEITYDAQVLSFVGIQNQAIPGNWYANYNGNKLVITYQATPYGTGYPMNGQLLNINFNYLGGFATALTFGNGCSIANQYLQTYSTVTYVNGSVTPVTGTGTVTLSQEIAPATSDVALDVTMSGAGFSDVKALTYKIGYDQSKLTFAQVVNSVLGGTISASASSGVVTITWTGTSQNLSASTNVFDVKFVYNGGGTTPVTFEPGCQVSNSSLALIPVSYVDGEVLEAIGTTTLEIADVIGTQGNVETVPLTLGSIAGGGYLGSMTLKIAYDNSLLTYTGFNYGTITTGISATALNGVVTVTWSKSNNTLDLSGVIMSLKFMYNTSLAAPITFGPGCVLNRTNLSNITMAYTDGSIMSCNPAIGTQPVNANIVYGANAVFTVVASNVCYYQWQVKTTPMGSWTDLTNAAPYSGVATASLTVTSPTLAYEDYSYRCVLGPSTNTNVVSIVFAPAVITVSPNGQPLSQTESDGGNVAFSVGATGVASYQWEEFTGTWNPISDGGIYSGATTSVLSLTGISSAVNGNKYRCVMLPGNTTTDGLATLTVTYTVSGYLNYAEDLYMSIPTRPITFSTVELRTSDGLTVLQTTSTDGTGYYEFAGVANDSYMLTASTTKAWGGSDIDDAIDTYDFWDQGMPILTGMHYLAGDVNTDTFVDIDDAIDIYDVWDLAISPYWAASEWIFESPVISVANASVLQDILGICSGDVNASYDPLP